MRAIVIACPTEELLFFVAAATSPSAGKVVVVTVSDRIPTESESRKQQFFSAVSRFGLMTESLGLSVGENGRFDVDAVREGLGKVFADKGVNEVFTHAIQGDKGKRYRADVAMAVWLATDGLGSLFRAKHTMRVARVLRATEAHVLAAYEALLVEYCLIGDAERCWISHHESYTHHSREEALVAYRELSQGLDGARLLAADGDPDPWGYYSSQYAAGRALAVARLVAKALEGKANGEVWEVGPASGHVTRRLLTLRDVATVVALEAFPEFTNTLRQRLGCDPRLTLRTVDVRQLDIWRCDVAVLVDCLSFYLTPTEQVSVVRRAAQYCTVIVGGELTWASTLVETLAREYGLRSHAEEHHRGAFEPLRKGQPIHSFRPPWAAFLLRFES